MLVYGYGRISNNKNMNTSEKAREMSKVRWGDKLSCRLVTRNGVQVAQCQWNGQAVTGMGKNNLSALKAVFKNQ